MAGIIAFLPDYEGQDRDELTRRGLGCLLDPALTPIFTTLRQGPGGKAGALVAFLGATLDVPKSYEPATQEWMEAPPDGDFPKGRYWIGYVTGQKPSAGDLQRSTLIDGEPVALCDGGVWVIPCCEFAPKRLTRNRLTGDELTVPADEHKYWVDWSNALFRLFVSDGFQAIVEKERVVHIPNGLGYAALSLAKNYRVNLDIVDLLQLVDQHKAFDIARVATGMSFCERVLAQKKSMAG